MNRSYLLAERVSSTYVLHWLPPATHRGQGIPVRSHNQEVSCDKTYHAISYLVCWPTNINPTRRPNPNQRSPLKHKCRNRGGARSCSGKTASAARLAVRCCTHVRQSLWQKRESMACPCSALSSPAPDGERDDRPSRPSGVRGELLPTSSAWREMPHSLRPIDPLCPDVVNVWFTHRSGRRYDKQEDG